MPRNSSGVYNTPPGTHGTPNTTILSANYNSNVDDVAADLNVPRPIVAGGTGATTAAGALTAFGAVAKAGDTMSGSLSITGSLSATVSVNSQYCYLNSINNSIYTNNTDTIIRQGTGSTIFQKGDGSATLAYIDNSGNLYTGAGTGNFGSVNSPYCYLNGTSNAILWDGGANTIIRQGTGTAYFQRGDGTTLAYVDNSGNLYTGGTGNFVGTIVVGDQTDAGTVYFGNTATRYLQYSGKFNLIGGALNVGSNTIQMNGANAFDRDANYTYIYDSVPRVRFYIGASGTTYQRSSTHSIENIDGSDIFLYLGADECRFSVNAPYVKLGQGFAGHQGSGAGATYQRILNFNWSGQLESWVETTFVGFVSFTSDYRAKKDIAPLSSMWETVKALRPIKYTHQEFTPPGSLEKQRAMAKDGEEIEPLIATDDIERWGFVAHELQETLTPSAASAEKDAPEALQSPNPMTVIAALTKALQEAMARIEALEQRAAAH